MPDPMGLENILAMYLAGVAKRNQMRGETPYTLAANDDRQPFIHFVEPPRVNYVKKPSKVKPGAKPDAKATEPVKQTATTQPKPKKGDAKATVTEKDFLSTAQIGELAGSLEDFIQTLRPKQPEPVPYIEYQLKPETPNPNDPAAAAMADFEAAVRASAQSGSDANIFGPAAAPPKTMPGQNGAQIPNPFAPAPAPTVPGANPAVIAAITESGLDVNDPMNAAVVAQLSKLSPATIVRLGQQITARGYKGNDTKSMWSDLASIMA